jgi:hypothetical protein
MMGAFALTNGAILEMFSDPNCVASVGSRNVWDNSCATGVPGFQSYMITTAGGEVQQITTYSADACAGDNTSCHPAVNTNVCYSAADSAGGSNAINSAGFWGVV